MKRNYFRCMRITAAVLWVLVLQGCAGQYGEPFMETKDAMTPYVVVLGTAQDGGLPQIGCDSSCCVGARKDLTKRRFTASLLVVDPRTGKRWLIDASPDLREQVELARNHPVDRTGKTKRPPLFDGIFLTHAHTGHYTGLIHLARPAYGARNMPVYGSARMCDFLKGNGPWSFMVENGNIDVNTLIPDASFTLGDALTITPFLVPHRAEFTDTFGYLIRGPHRSLLYIPDIDKWEWWDRRIEDAIAGADVALLDGTFFEDGELPGRAMADIPHPFIQESAARFRSLSDAERVKIFFTHLNHSNPAAVAGGSEASRIAALGMGIARDGQRIEL